MQKKNFDVTGMSCSACSARVEKAVSSIPGVDNVNVNLLKNSMTVEFDDAKTNVGEIVKAVTDAGYGASEGVKIKEVRFKQRILRLRLKRLPKK